MKTWIRPRPLFKNGPYTDRRVNFTQMSRVGRAAHRLFAVTGWSYGGILTNHVITKTGHFKAAVTGVSAALYVANFGHDQYQR